MRPVRGGGRERGGLSPVNGEETVRGRPVGPRQIRGGNKRGVGAPLGQGSRYQNQSRSTFTASSFEAGDSESSSMVVTLAAM